ncbi:MAG: DNA topoisomerase (ATP-hydrolyzing) subunit A [Clostridia bacterium]|nr:DNA topoisomerase (ATP-hydrolyzing) subunit A [Clostridia bacterium]
MARKKRELPIEENLPEAEVTYQPITETIESNYMPYVMSVIISRAIPEIDGFKPSHRKLLYTMYKMGLLTGNRTKSANVVGQTMKLNPHGDAAIYETLVRLTRGNGALLHPFIDSKGSFGKQYSSEMAFAASRYTEVKLDAFATELFEGIDKDAVDLIDNYDSTTKEPTLLPTTFPNVLVTPNMGIAVGMASNICSFNLREICEGTIALLKNPDTTVDQLIDIVKAPDFSGGAYILYDREALKEVYTTGRGNIRLRAKYRYSKENNCIEILEIPYSTTIEAIMKRVTDLVKENKLKEISDLRDEIDLSGFKLTFDLKRGTDPEKLMAKLFKLTPLEDNFNCNFNVLIDSSPRQMGVFEIIREWIKFRVECVRREYSFNLKKKEDKLHLLLGLGKILLDIDKAIRIVRETSLEKDVVPNLMSGFNIDEIQAEYIAEIKLRNLNREYILNRINEIESLQNEIDELKKIISSERLLKNCIVKQLEQIIRKYGVDRRSEILYENTVPDYQPEDDVENYNVRIVITKDGYFKKITLVSLRGNDEHKHKEGDYIVSNEDATNRDEIIFFSDKANAYKAHVSDFDTCKASELGDYIPAKLGFDEGEKVIFMKKITEYTKGHNIIFIFKNGKGVRVPIESYQTKNNRRKLVSAYSDVSPVAAIFYESEPFDLMLISNVGKAIIINSSLIPIKTTRNAQGVVLYSLKKKQELTAAVTDFDGKYANTKKYRKSKIPATGVVLEELDVEASQMTML